MNSERRSFFALLLRAGREVVQTLVHEGVHGATDRVEVMADRAAAAGDSVSEPEPAPAPAPLTVRPVVWPGLPASGFTAALESDQFDWAEQSDLPALEAQVAAGHLALLPLNTGMALGMRGICVYLLGVVGPESAALISVGDAVHSWLDLMWNWAAVPSEQPALLPLAYRLSGGDSNRLTGCFGVIAEAEVLERLRDGRLQAAVLSGAALQEALTIPGVRVAVDMAAITTAALPGAPWAPLTGLFCTEEALIRAPRSIAALSEAYATGVLQADPPLEYVPAEVCREWVESLLGQQLLHHPSPSPAEERWGQ